VKTTNIYGGQDPRELPAYTFREAAHYLRIPVSTIRAWARGHAAADGGFAFRPVLHLRPDQLQLSFFNLIEAFVVDGLRRKHNFSMQRLRPAIDHLESIASATAHPLAELQLAVFNDDLFVEMGELLNLSRPGQVAMRDVLAKYLRRVERGPAGAVQKLYPFVRRQADLAEPKVIVIDPLISFGRPVIAGTGIPTSVVAERFKAGEPVEELAADYRVAQAQIEEAIRCELELAA